MKPKLKPRFRAALSLFLMLALLPTASLWNVSHARPPRKAPAYGYRRKQESRRDYRRDTRRDYRRDRRDIRRDRRDDNRYIPRYRARSYFRSYTNR